MGFLMMLPVLEQYLCIWFVFTSVEGLANSGESPKWNQQSVEVREGDDLSVSCTVIGLGNIDAIRVTHIKGKHSTTVTDNASIKFPFQKLPRYKVHYELQGNVGIVHLHYRGIQGRDSGSLGCYKLSDENNMATIHINVLVPLGDVYVISISETGQETRITDATSEVTLQDEDIVGVGCVASVSNSSAYPELEIAIDDEDKTDDAVAKKNLTSVSSNDDLTVYKSEEKLLMIFKTIDLTLSQKNWTCTARVKGYEERTKSVVLRVKYAPAIDCPETHYHKSIGANITFSCNVMSNPNADVKWQIGDEEEELERSGIVTEKALDEERIQVNFTITDLKSSHFTTYTITASNALGIITKTISLEEDVEYGTKKNFPETEETEVEKHTDLTVPVTEDNQPTDSDIKKPEIQETPKDHGNHQKNLEIAIGPDQSASLVNSSNTVMQPMFLLVFMFPTVTRWLQGI